MKIRKLETKDIESTVELWYKTSVIAHNFISTVYWRKNMEAMATIYLPNSETFVSVQNERIVGFISMSENYLAAIFVDNELQGKGIGKTLLNFIKKKRSTIQLKVFKKNIQGIEFYKSQNFNVVSENTDEDTGELEYLMEWNKKIKPLTYVVHRLADVHSCNFTPAFSSTDGQQILPPSDC